MSTICTKCLCRSSRLNIQVGLIWGICRNVYVFFADSRNQIQPSLMLPNYIFHYKYSLILGILYSSMCMMVAWPLSIIQADLTISLLITKVYSHYLIGNMSRCQLHFEALIRPTMNHSYSPDRYTQAAGSCNWTVYHKSHLKHKQDVYSCVISKLLIYSRYYLL